MAVLWLLARHYPPAISGGARRPCLLASGLRALGWDVRVIAPSLPEGEPGLVAPHPNRDPTTAPGIGGFSLRNTAREMLLWPDADIRWSMRAARMALAALPKPNWIITTSPPESIHSAGLWLKRQTGARWLADFRDHWLEQPHRRERTNPLRAFGERLIARHLLKYADAVTAVDSAIQGELRTLGAASPHILPHFAPPMPPQAASLPVETINVLHAGAIALSDPLAEISQMLRPFEAAWSANPLLRLHLAGRVTDAERAQIEASPARAGIVRHGPVPFEQSLAMQAGSDALIFVASRKMHVPPSKIVEYLAANKPIIACGDGPWRTDPRVPQGDPAAKLTALGKGQSGDPTLPRPPSAAEIATQLNAILARY